MLLQPCDFGPSVFDNLALSNLLSLMVFTAKFVFGVILIFWQTFQSSSSVQFKLNVFAARTRSECIPRVFSCFRPHPRPCIHFFVERRYKKYTFVFIDKTRICVNVKYGMSSCKGPMGWGGGRGEHLHRSLFQFEAAP